jgi:hypothetical protein
VTTVFAKPLGFVRRLYQCERASISIMLAAAGTVLALSSLLAFDVARAHMALSRLQTATDAAALAATRDINSPTLDQDIRQIFNANFPPGYLGSNVADIRTVMNHREGLVQQVQLSVTVELPSPIASVLRHGGSDMHILTTEARAERRTFGAEVALVLDNTGSMYWDDKIGSLRRASQALLDVLFNGQESVPNLYVSIVPYTAQVNIGPRHANWVRDPSVNPREPHAWSDYSPTTWKGCVFARSAPMDQSDDPPAVQAFDPAFWPSAVENGLYGWYYQGKIPSRYYYEGSDRNIWPDLAGLVRESAGYGSPIGPNMNCPDTITPLTASHSVLSAAVERQVHWWNGGTMANVGLVWGWRTLSSRWQGVWLHETGLPIAADRPLPAKAVGNDKIIVMMTDGNNEWVGMHMTAYGRPDWGLATPETLNDRMLDMCRSIKAEGIIIYTITFGSNVSNSTRDLYTGCASGERDHPFYTGPKYFHAPDDAELNSAFRDIGDQLSELRIVQ